MLLLIIIGVIAVLFLFVLSIFGMSSCFSPSVAPNDENVGQNNRLDKSVKQFVQKVFGKNNVKNPVVNFFVVVVDLSFQTIWFGRKC